MKLIPPIPLLAALAFALPQPARSDDVAPRPATRLPRVFLLDPWALADARDRAAKGDAALVPALARLRRDADTALKLTPPSVMDKKLVPPSGDKHDYMSFGPYWWPDPKKPDGLPYIRRDGKVNPARGTLDNVGLGKVCSAADTLALAFHYTRHQPYAAHAARLLRTWFLDPATRMNPNLNYGQAIPGRCTGRGIGIIDTTRLIRLVDAGGLLAGSEAWTDSDQKALVAWFRSYLTWLRTSKHGKAEDRTSNNHATWYDVQVVSFALFVGDDATARTVVERAPTRRIATQIQPDGRQPRELARTKSFDYSTMNLAGFFDLATLAQHAGLDLWNFTTPDGRGIRKALDWLLPFATGEQPWRHKQLGKLRSSRILPLLRRAAIACREPRYEQAIAKIPDTDPSDDRFQLLYPTEVIPR